MADAAAPEAPVSVPPVLRSFMIAQFANLFKFSLWWTSLSPLLFAMANGNASIIGVGRIVYNVAICVFSPLGALLVERFHPKTILNVAAIIRFVIYVILVPLVWLLFNTSLIGAMSFTAVYFTLCIFIFFDGVAVAGSVILDIDMGGLDILGGRFGIEVTDGLRNYFNSAQELFFSLCFIFFAPAMAFVGIGAKHVFASFIDKRSLTDDQAESGTLVLIFMFGFALASIVQWLFIARIRDDVPSSSHGASGEDGHNSLHERLTTADSSDAGGADPNAEDAAGAGGTTCGGILSDLKESVIVVFKNKPILFRLVFLGFEIAFEDAAIVVIAAQMGLRCPWLGAGSPIRGNIWTAVAVAAGKLGGAIASISVMKLYTPPEEPRGYFLLFVLTTVSTLVTCGFPLVDSANRSDHISDLGAQGVHLTLFFLYFFFSTLPKLGFMSLLQSLVSKVENGHRAFGFIAVIATTMDALIIMGLSAFFIDPSIELSQALWYVAYCYMAHGVLELFLGPILVLRPLQTEMEVEKEVAAAEESEANKNGGGGGDAPTAPVEKTGEYTQRTAAVPVESARPTTPRGNERSVKTAMLSTSQPTPIYAVTRRRSNLDAGDDGGDGILVASAPKVGSYVRQGMPKSPRSPRVGTGSAFS